MTEPATIQIEQLFDRAQRPTASSVGRSRFRTVGTFFVLVILVVLIGGYLFVTDPDRVRNISQKYLSQLTGGPVRVERASLSIFEGLRLDGIRIQVDDSDKPESLLLEAKSLHIGYNPAALLFGRIEATRILALEPRVHLVENLDAGLWNFQRLDTPSAPVTPGQFSGDSRPMKLPEIVLRNARVDYAQIAQQRWSNVGTITIEGQLTPDLQNNYRFRLQSRGGTSGVFPIAEGWLAPGGRQLGVVLRDVEFVDEIKTILPSVVRRFWEDHKLAGRIGETRVSFFRNETGKAGFRVETDLDGVQMTVPPEKWLGPKEIQRIDMWRRANTRLAGPVLGGSQVARLLIDAMKPSPMVLDEVDGTFVFTEDSIKINSLVARVENNRFKLAGELMGYGPSSAFKMRIESLQSENILIPESPRYVSSMPWPVQNIYYRFRPRGAASFWIEMARDGDGDRPTLAGEVQVHDAAFTFDRFPYPVDRANGAMRIGADPASGREQLDIISIVGRGYRGGANENATIEVSGKISPLDATAGVDMVIKGWNVASEPLLIESMPPQTRQTVRSFDAAGTGKLPSFLGDFECRVRQPVGFGHPWVIDTAIDLRNASGVLAKFPYPLKNVAAKMVVHDEFIDLQKVSMPRGDGSVELSGRIDWSRRLPGTDEPLVQADLKLTARKIPIDADLMAAIPEAKRKLLQKLNLTGLLDADGRIMPEGPDTDEATVDMAIKLSDGAVELTEKKVRVTDMTAEMHLGPTKGSISSLTARRGDATIEGQATFDWSKEKELQVTAGAKVRALMVDDALIASLPESARTTAEALKPQGVVDLDIDYAGGNGTRVTLRPKSLTITPSAVPLAMQDVRGEIVIDRQNVTLKDVTAKVGDAMLYAAGTIEPATGAASISLAGRDLKVTEELLKAFPAAVLRAVKGAELEGTVAFDVTKLMVTPVKDKSPSIEFDGSVWLQKSSLQVGVPMTEVNGVIAARGIAIDGQISELAGDISFDSLKLAGRDVSKLTAKIIKPKGQDLLQIARIDGRIAGGQIGGQIDSILSQKDPRFGLSLVLRNANVTDLTGELDKPIDGRLTASLSLEGKWDDPTTRRGRGDVIVEGREMYRVPVLFGLMQMANLTLPIEAPIQQAGLRYSLEGNRLTFDAIDLRSKVSVMQGNGWLDFGTRQVRMTLTMGNPATDAVPIFGELFRGVRQDMLQIRVRGSLEEPKVGASAFNTLTTTVDEVLKGDK